MIKFPVFAAIAALSLALPGAAIANETVAHLKGNLAVPAPKPQAASSARPACHPEPSKGRDCRHRTAQANAKAIGANTGAAALAQTEAASPQAGALAANERAR
ncbi:hypothetical protein WBP06_01545 [Novosphingobium sp. BL-8H]|uniref:hypothetical protein n=1 Tax=Novosphingobium sp. BL-8H TaxID=3127640 RepID=UPI003757C65E